MKTILLGLGFLFVVLAVAAGWVALMLVILPGSVMVLAGVLAWLCFDRAWEREWEKGKGMCT